MKKILLLAALGLCAIEVQAGNNGSVTTAYYGGYPSEYAANNQAGTLRPVRSGYQVYADQSQVPERVYTRTYPMAYGYAQAMPATRPNVRMVNNKSASAKDDNKTYYGVLRAGYGSTFGWQEPFGIPRAWIFNGAFGMYLPHHFRADIDLGYHIKDILYRSHGEPTLRYSQYDLGINVYYDVNLSKSFKPFLGAGIGLTNSKVSGKTAKTEIKFSDDETNLSFTATAGIAYYLTTHVALEALMRARYILCDGDLYNFEGLMGIRYDF